MKTEQVRFNIIWLDDQIDTLYQDYKDILLKAGIKVLGKGAHDVTEFEQQIQKYKYVVDAVVTDANLNLKVEDDFDGLIDVSYLIEQCNKTRAIPFFVFTGRDNMSTTVNKRTIAKFDGVFEKQKGITDLIDAVKSSVIKVNSPEFRIRNKYAAELEAAALIPSNEDRLLNALLYAYSEDWKNTEDYFNPMRKIVEAIFIESKNLKIIPPIDKLNAISAFLGNRKYENYCVIEGEEIMPKTLARSLRYFLDIVQDASHELKEDWNKLRVDDYVRHVKNINIFKSVLHIAMDLCLWFKRIKEEIDSETYKCKWFVKPSEPIEEKEPPKPKRELSDSIRNVYEKKCHELELDEKGFWHCKECYISITQWKEGDIVELSELSFNTNTKTKDKYPYYAKYKRVSNNKSEN